jgi:hypothetical protein
MHSTIDFIELENSAFLASEEHLMEGEEALE